MPSFLKASRLFQLELWMNKFYLSVHVVFVVKSIAHCSIIIIYCNIEVLKCLWQNVTSVLSIESYQTSAYTNSLQLTSRTRTKVLMTISFSRIFGY